MKELRWALRLVLWLAETTWLGVVATWRLGILVSRLPALLAETRRCPRGHVNAMYGVYECSHCHALIESWVFARCCVCGQSAGWTPCGICHLPIKNPLVI